MSISLDGAKMTLLLSTVVHSWANPPENKMKILFYWNPVQKQEKKENSQDDLELCNVTNFCLEEC